MSERSLGTKISKPVLSPASGLLQRKCACGQHTIAGGECAECRKHKEKGTLQRHSAGGPGVAPPIVHETLRSPGHPLDAAMRSFFEPRFGRDFSRVRVHTDAQAAQSAKAVNALAYIVGNNVVFGAEKYAPDTGSGKQLLAHELTHVLQQNNPQSTPVQPKLIIGESNNDLEKEADRNADRVMQNESSSSMSAVAGAESVLQCAAKDTSAECQDLANIRVPSHSALWASRIAPSFEAVLQRQPATSDGMGPAEIESETDESGSEIGEDGDLGFDIVGEDEAPGDDGPLEFEDDPEFIAMPKRKETKTVDGSLSLPKTAGHPLDPFIRVQMEDRFGHSFSHVQVHTDGEASESAEKLGAHAFTSGSHIYFADNAYRPGTASGNWLLAHELTHVIQQGQSAALWNSVQRKPKKSETPKATKGKTPTKQGARHVLVILAEQQALAMEGDRVVKKMGISSGRKGHETPTGNFSIYEKDADHKSSTYGKCDRRKVSRGKSSCKEGEKYEGTPMPNFQRFHGSVGFHEGPLPGHPDSHGCVRLSEANAKWLFDWTKKGTKVTVVTSRPAKKGIPSPKPSEVGKKK